MKEINDLVSSITAQLKAAGFTVPSLFTAAKPDVPATFEPERNQTIVPLAEAPVKVIITPTPMAELPPAVWQPGPAIANVEPIVESALTPLQEEDRKGLAATFEAVDALASPSPVAVEAAKAEARAEAQALEDLAAVMPPVTQEQIEAVPESVDATKDAPPMIVLDSIPQPPANTPVALRLLKGKDGKVVTLDEHISRDEIADQLSDYGPSTYRPLDFTSELKDLPEYVRYVYAVAINIIKIALNPEYARGVLGTIMSEGAILWPENGRDGLDDLAERLQDNAAHDSAYDEIVARVEAWLKSRALAAMNQDFFAAACSAAHVPLKRDETRKLFKAIRARLVETGEWPKPVGGKLQQQVDNLADAKVDAKDQPEAGQQQKHLKKAMAVSTNSSFVLVAQRIARDLGKNGPITIDDVTQAMSREFKVAPGEGDKAHVWKGSVFSTSEWAQVGTMASRMKEAHGRPVALWALKTWLATNTLNGVQSTASAYNLVKIFRDFQVQHPNTPVDRCNWYIGDEKLSADVRHNILTGGTKLYGIPVAFVPGAVGALLMPPNYAAQTPAPKG